MSARHPGNCRLITAIILLLAAYAFGDPSAQASPGDYAAADRLIQAGRWQEATRLAYDRRRADPSLGRYILWRLYRSREGDFTFEQIAAFLSAVPDWPETRSIRTRAEEVMPPDLPPQETVAYFEQFPARTPRGAIYHAEALIALGREAEASALIREFWRMQPMSRGNSNDIERRFGRFLTREDHIARLDRMIWIGAFSSARHARRWVDSGHSALADARILLATQSPGVDGAIARVPAALRNDPGLVYERLRWRRRKGFTERALELIEDKPSPDVSGSPRGWWLERHILARRLMEQGAYGRAYELVARHGQSDGLSHAQAEFLAGFLALRFLDRPQEALAHFVALHDNVSSPISLARGAYWAGRAAEASGDNEAAVGWFQSAGAHGSTFYGQQARLRLGVEEALVGSLGVPPTLDDTVQGSFEAREKVRIARNLHLAGLTDEAEPFVDQLGRIAQTPEDLFLTVRMALEMQRPAWAVSIGRRGSSRGVATLSIGYPVLSGEDGAIPGDIDPALMHALIRQESGFDMQAVSPAGARGLMQLMPATAREVSRRLGERYTRSKLTQDPAFNLRLGSRYMRDVLNRFDGSVAMAAAGYNAGPGRVNRWLREFGDPRAGDLDLIDWIELIPIYETRNYVQRIIEGAAVYRWKLDGSEGSLSTN